MHDVLFQSFPAVAKLLMSGNIRLRIKEYSVRKTRYGGHVGLCQHSSSCGYRSRSSVCTLRWMSIPFLKLVTDSAAALTSFITKVVDLPHTNQEQ